MSTCHSLFTGQLQDGLQQFLVQKYRTSRNEVEHRRNAWLPDPDDIDLPAPGTPAHQDLQAAWRAFGLVTDTMTRSGYAKAYDEPNATRK